MIHSGSTTDRRSDPESGGGEAKAFDMLPSHRAYGLPDERPSHPEEHSIVDRRVMDWSVPCGRCCVLDLETGPDRYAQSLAGRSKVGADSCLREIRVATVLGFDEDGSGIPSNFSMSTFDIKTHGESGIIRNVENLVAACVDAGTLITFNGAAFDLPVLRSRRLRWWLVDDDASMRSAAAGRHVDVMLEFSMAGQGRWPTLVDACASVGMALHGPTRIGPSSFPYAVEKCEADVAGTAALFLYALAGNRRSDAALRAGLPALSKYLRSAASGRPHLATVAMSRAMAQGGPWGTVH